MSWTEVQPEMTWRAMASGGVGALELGDGAEGIERFDGLRAEGRDLRAGGGCGELVERGGVDARVLADIERLQVQAVGADLEQQRVDEQLGEAAAVVLRSRLWRSVVRSARNSDARV